MQPTADLLDRITSPPQRAILLNWWRHVHLEGAGEFDRIVAPDMMADHPVYRVIWGANPAVIEGKEGVLAVHDSVGEAVLWQSDARIAVGDWGVADEITFHQLVRGADLTAIGYDMEKDDALYHVSSRQAFTWPYDERARLAGEHLYEDKTSLQVEEIDPSEGITPARVRENRRGRIRPYRPGRRAAGPGQGAHGWSRQGPNRVRMYRVAPRTHDRPGLPADQEPGALSCRGRKGARGTAVILRGARQHFSIRTLVDSRGRPHAMSPDGLPARALAGRPNPR